MQRCNRCGCDYGGHSMGGPGICPACDCGYSVEKAREINNSRDIFISPNAQSDLDELRKQLAEKEAECERLRIESAQEFVNWWIDSDLKYWSVADDRIQRWRKERAALAVGRS